MMKPSACAFRLWPHTLWPHAALVGAILLGAPAPVVAQDQSAPAIIGAQIDAFLADDFETAFGFASDTIRAMFGTPERFGQMVVTGYPMVHRPASVTYLERVQRPGGTGQRVLITDAAGASFVLEYLMIDTPEGLKINGVRLLPNAGPGV